MKRNAKQLQAKSRQHHITRLSDSHYMITSASSGHQYGVNPVKMTCSCPWGQHRPRNDKRSGCSHLLAVLDHIKWMEEERRLGVWGSEQEALDSKRALAGGFDSLVLTSRKV
jgi:hypothetical protein